MKKIILLILSLVTFTSIGLYTRPSFIMVGKLDWLDVLTKGYFVGSFTKFFTQGMIDESFYWVGKFTLVGLVFGLISIFLLGGSSKGSSKAKKKA